MVVQYRGWKLSTYVARTHKEEQLDRDATSFKATLLIHRASQAHVDAAMNFFRRKSPGSQLKRNASETQRGIETQRDLTIIVEGVTGVRQLQFPLALLPFSYFKAARQLRTHEEVRHHLVYADIYDDLADLQAYLGSELYEEMQGVMMAAPHYDATRQPHEFKGFYLPEV